MADPSPLDAGAAQDLRTRFAQGDASAFEALARREQDLLYTLCLRLSGSPADAEDAAQEALLRAFERCASFDPRHPFRPWLLTIGANVCRDRARSAWVRRVFSLDLGSLVVADPTVRAYEAVDEDFRVRQALATLPWRLREAVALFHLDGLSYADMSAITGANVAALKQRVRRGNQQLRVALERMYPELTADRISCQSVPP